MTQKTLRKQDAKTDRTHPHVPTEDNPEVQAYCPTPTGAVIEYVSWGGHPSDKPHVEAIRVVESQNQKTQMRD